eukprot:6483933-Amphidinium_carterae.4
MVPTFHAFAAFVKLCETVPRCAAEPRALGSTERGAGGGSSEPLFPPSWRRNPGRAGRWLGNVSPFCLSWPRPLWGLGIGPRPDDDPNSWSCRRAPTQAGSRWRCIV